MPAPNQVGVGVAAGATTACSLGSSSQTVQYHGAPPANGGVQAIFVEGDPSFVSTSGVLGGDSIHIEEGHTNYVTVSPLTLSSLPDTISLTMAKTER
jgi:hypothetical protein